jgi:hypothetical protein
MARPRADVGKSHRVEENADVAFVIIDAEALLDDTFQIDAPPAHDAVEGAIGACLNDGGKFGFLCLRQARFDTPAMPIEKAVRPGFVEVMDPVAQRLAIHSADPRGVGAVHAVHDRGQRQQAAALIVVLRAFGKPAKLGRRIVSSQTHG